jgi:hypothetical protein
MNDGDPYDRQRRLPGIGSAGQSQIERSEARLDAGPGGAIALGFLVRAGVERASITRAAASPDFPHARAFRFGGPLAVARGAHQALSHLLSVVRTQ